jgi:curli biogenesis system outer membrane secretion channel CsgG
MRLRLVIVVALAVVALALAAASSGCSVTSSPATAAQRAERKRLTASRHPLSRWGVHTGRLLSQQRRHLGLVTCALLRG